MNKASHQNDQETFDKLWKLIEPIKKGMLHTLAGSNADEIHSRPMQNVQDSFNGKIYFFTNKDASQAEEIREESSVAVSYVDVNDDNYVHLRGTAITSTDQALINELWNRYVELWFPEGKYSDNVRLIEITVTAAEYWESHNKAKQTWSTIKASLSDERPDMSRNEEVNLS